jgi:hypothetical protein
MSSHGASAGVTQREGRWFVTANQSNKAVRPSIPARQATARPGALTGAPPSTFEQTEAVA